jgi:hypothetical protein
MSSQTEPQKTIYYFYELSLNEKAWTLYKPEHYSTDAVTKMIITAKCDVDDRLYAINQEWGKDCPGINMHTAMFWGPTIEEQIKYIQCVPIGTSFILETRLICSVERHDTG